ncbi:SDR family NAD(P)-dependent oxidoreductase [Amycolatopsis sp. A133]|uniref:SDR family NAD(P)-dependent oxidoreductase n=1 Tax=Amycolatopsis sp. A133 TaxID=3064472 RepID=UPI0027FA6E6E|nr:SDR family NAD(P)-dependent oxidoreductase [Amycolatopsis sp. A133]MDQ7808644.1 SDR family NAD(P)-dependent oxidoreductase [Amycolatopsis sp. A133]
MDLYLGGKRALVTGASKGIGAAIAETLAGEGCDLHLAARNGGALESHARKLREEHGVAVTVHAVDLRVAADLERLTEATGDADIVVNSAGDIPAGTLEDVGSEFWRHAWNLEVFGYIDLVRCVYPRFRARGHGVIVNVIGTGGAGNAALMAFIKALGGEGPRHGVRVVGVNPGPVATERVTTMRAAKRRR